MNSFKIIEDVFFFSVNFAFANLLERQNVDFRVESEAF